jgi:hypothetical protein
MSTMCALSTALAAWASRWKRWIASGVALSRSGELLAEGRVDALVHASHAAHADQARELVLVDRPTDEVVRVDVVRSARGHSPRAYHATYSGVRLP